MPDRSNWIIKALYETAGEVRDLFVDSMGEGVPVHKRPLADQPSLAGLAREARNTEATAGWHLVQIVLRNVDQLQLHDYEWLDTDDEESGPDAYGFVSQYATLRRETCGLLWSLMPDEWERTATHPFMGPISVMEVAERLHRNDLDIMFRARRVMEELTAASGQRE